jgi:glycosyltransferase involved in cell wall biosynthesis
MKILLVHNRYHQPGGEDTSMLAEEGVLRAAGHRVVEYIRHNDEIKEYGLRSKATLSLRTVWAWDSYREIKALLARNRPDLAHFHNTFPLISPAAYYACREAGVPVVQTLQNYRLLCPAATFLNHGRLCEACVEHSLWRGVADCCYRHSRAATTTVALMLAVHRRLGTWTRLVDCYIALTEFGRRKFIEGGLPAEKIAVKPHFVFRDPGIRDGRGEYALFVGRLTEEKGLRTLLAAWERLSNRVPLEIVGDGPLRPELEKQVSHLGLSEARRGKPAATSISFHGHLTPEDVTSVMKRARFLLFPSIWYEPFGLTNIEAFACGVPVICSRLGAMQEIVADGRTGLHFCPGNAEDLAAKVEWAWARPEETVAMGRAARADYEAKYTAERNYEMLMEIYSKVLGARG